RWMTARHASGRSPRAARSLTMRTPTLLTRGLLAFPLARSSARFVRDAQVADARSAVHRLHHVVERERRHGRGGECFHLHAGDVARARLGRDARTVVDELDVDV